MILWKTPSAVASPAVLSDTSTVWCRWTSRWPWWSVSPSSSSVWPRLSAWWCVASSTAVPCTTPAVAPTRGQTTSLTVLTTMGQTRSVGVSGMEIKIFSFFHLRISCRETAMWRPTKSFIEQPRTRRLMLTPHNMSRKSLCVWDRISSATEKWSNWYNHNILLTWYLFTSSNLTIVDQEPTNPY